MALIEIYHVVADMFPVDPDWTVGITEGQIVDLNANTGYVARANGAANEVAIGVAGDTLQVTGGTAARPNTPYAAQLVVNSAGGQQWTQNRVSDAFNETLASSKLTVYHSGGKFATTEYATLLGAAPVNYTFNQNLYVDANSRFTSNVSASGQVVAVVTRTPYNHPSGVPGTDTVNQFGQYDGSISLGTYLEFKLNI
jgi:hypothetical protein